MIKLIYPKNMPAEMKRIERLLVIKTRDLISQNGLLLERYIRLCSKLLAIHPRRLKLKKIGKILDVYFNSYKKFTFLKTKSQP